MGEEDDEFFWAAMEQHPDGSQHSDHDSDDSNAESYYANSYPDEDGGPYGHGSDADDEEGGVADGSKGSDDGEGREGGGGGGSRRRAGGGEAAGVPRGLYRTESDDYSAHSSYLSDEEQQDEVDRRRRGIFVH